MMSTFENMNVYVTIQLFISMPLFYVSIDQLVCKQYFRSIARKCVKCELDSCMKCPIHSTTHKSWLDLLDWTG